MFARAFQKKKKKKGQVIQEQCSKPTKLETTRTRANLNIPNTHKLGKDAGKPAT
jgi:hypothetical protein